MRRLEVRAKTRDYFKHVVALVFALVLLSSYGIMIPQKVFAQDIPVIPTVFLNDTFDSSLDGWQHYGDPGYNVILDSTTGQPSPSANISGDAWLGICSKHGMEKQVDISQYLTGPLTLGFNWRASSSSGGAGSTTIAELRIDDASTGNQLFIHRLVNNGIADTGWQSYSTDISPYVAQVQKIQVDLYLYDCWSANWNENNWYDNIQLVNGSVLPIPLPSSPDASASVNATATVGDSTVNGSATIKTH